MARKPYEDDDGRTIADMSEVTGGGLFLPRRREKEPREPQRPAGHAIPDSPYTTGERWMAALGTLKAALLIASAYLGGLTLLVIILLILWKAL